MLSLRDVNRHTFPTGLRRDTGIPRISHQRAQSRSNFLLHLIKAHTANALSDCSRSLLPPGLFLWECNSPVLPWDRGLANAPFSQHGLPERPWVSWSPSWGLIRDSLCVSPVLFSLLHLCFQAVSHRATSAETQGNGVIVVKE